MDILRVKVNGEWKNIPAIVGPKGTNGVTFTPEVNAEGVISWTNDGGKQNPAAVSIKGPQGDDYVLTNQDKAEIAQVVEEDVTELIGATNGIAGLDANGRVPASQLPSYVDDVLEFANKTSFPATGETGKIYLDLEDNLTYRWSGTTYVEISPSLALGETSSTAFPGDRGASLELEMSAKAPGIFTDDEKAFRHENLIYPTKVTIYGHDKGFGNIEIANHKNLVPNVGNYSSTSNGLNWNRVNKVITFNGQATQNGYVELYDWLLQANYMPAGTYKYMIKIDKGNSTGTSAAHGFFIYYYEDGTRFSFDQVWISPETDVYEHEFTFEQPIKQMRILIPYHANNVYDNFKAWCGLYPIDTEYRMVEQTLANGESYEYTNVDHRWDVIDSMQYYSTVESLTDTKEYIDGKFEYVMPEEFGAVGDELVDDTASLQACVNYAIANNKVVRGFKSYKTTASIVIDGDYTDMYFKSIKYTGTGPAVKIGGRQNKFSFGSIDATSTGGQGIMLFSSARHHDTNRIIITGMYIRADQECVTMISDTGYYLLYIVMQIKTMISYNGNCIYGGPRTGEIQCYDTWFDCGKGWCFEGAYIKLENCTIESNCNGGVYAGFARIINCRITELIDCLMPGNSLYGQRSGIIFKQKPGANVSGYTCIQHCGIVYYESIDLSEVTPISDGTSSGSTSNWQTATVDGPICFGDLNYRYGHYLLGTKMILHGKDKICIPAFENVRHITEEVFDMRDPTPEKKPSRLSYPTKFIIESDNCVIWLAPSYCSEGYKEFTVDMSTKMATIYDRRGNLLFNPANYSNGIYQFKAIVDPDVDDLYQSPHTASYRYPINSGYCDVWSIQRIDPEYYTNAEVTTMLNEIFG